MPGHRSNDLFRFRTLPREARHPGEGQWRGGQIGRLGGIQGERGNVQGRDSRGLSGRRLPLDGRAFGSSVARDGRWERMTGMPGPCGCEGSSAGGYRW